MAYSISVFFICIFFSYVSFAGSLQNIFWQVYFLCNVEEKIFWPNLCEICRNVDDLVIIHAAPYSIHTYYLSLKTNCSILWWNTIRYNLLTSFYYLSLQGVVHSSLFRIELLSIKIWIWNMIYLFPSVTCLFWLRAQFSPTSFVEHFYIPGTVSCWGYKLEWDAVLVVEGLMAQGVRQHVIVIVRQEKCVPWGTWAEEEHVGQGLYVRLCVCLQMQSHSSQSSVALLYLMLGKLLH